MNNGPLRALLFLVALLFCIPALGQMTVTLQQGPSYSGTTDAWLWSGAPDVNESTNQNWNLRTPTTAAVLRFAIFAAEGGPVPDGATITSATLSVYKFSANDGTFNARRLLRPWNVSQVTWNSAATGSAWQTAGATGATDVTSAGEAQVTLGSVAGWGDLNVTAAVQAMAGGNNHGWRLQQTAGSTLPHEFGSADDNDAVFRPKLTLTYTSAPAGVTKTLQEGLNSYNGTTDAWLWSGDASTNVGAGATWNLRTPTTAAVLRFAIFAADGGPVPDDATISSATLSVYKFSANDGVFNARRLLRAWNESQVTWNNATTGGAWQTAGANGASDITAVGEAQVTLGSDPAWADFDVTAAVQAMAGGNNHGWRLQNTGGSTLPHDFGAKENGNAMLRPKLTITYSGGGGTGTTPPTASLSATPSSGDGPLTVTFSAAESTPGSAPINNLRLQFGHGSPPQEVNWSNLAETRQYTYPAGAASYTATLTVTTNDGSDDDVRQIQVTQPGGGDKFQSGRPASGLAVPTFHSMSLYFDGPGAPGTGQQVFARYRRATDDPANTSVWKEALPLYYDIRTTNPGCTGGCGLPYAWKGRGSVLHLQPGIEYVFEVAYGTSHATADWANGFHVPDPNAADPRYPSTWPDPLPASQNVVHIPSQTGTYKIEGAGAAGVPGAYKVYDGCITYNQQGKCTAKEVVNRGGNGVVTPFQNAQPSNDDAHAIIVRANYVIVRNVVARGAAQSGIYIAPGVTNVVIEDSEVFDWAYQPGYSSSEPSQNSWTAPDYWGKHQAGGIHLGGNNSRVVVQRNVIREPHYGAFPWDTGQVCSPDGTGNHHPLGPNGISVYSGGQQNVIRYNQITGHPTDKKHWMMDGIGGQENFSTTGSPGADSDIYQNIIMNVFDDAIEAEGGGRNVRVWGNYMSDTMVAVAATTAHYGPHYVWRNVVNHIRRCHQAITNTDNDWFAQAFKYGGRVKNEDDNQWYGDGRRYLFNNTLLQEQIGTYGEGAGRGIEAVNYGDGSVTSTIGRNNIFHVRSSTHSQAWSMEFGTGATGNTFTHNLYNGKYSTTVTPQPDGAYEFGPDKGRELVYKSGHGAGSVPGLGDNGSGAGNYQLFDTSFGRRMGTHVPNITRDIDGLAGAGRSGFEPTTGLCDASSNTGCPDPGAHQNGSTQSMKFGIKAGQ